MFEKHAIEDGVSSGALLFPSRRLTSQAVTLDVPPVTHASVRLAYRHDESKDPIFFRSDVGGHLRVERPYIPNARSRDTVTLGLTAWFRVARSSARWLVRTRRPRQASRHEPRSGPDARGSFALLAPVAVDVLRLTLEEHDVRGERKVDSCGGQPITQLVEHAVADVHDVAVADANVVLRPNVGIGRTTETEAV